MLKAFEFDDGDLYAAENPEQASRLYSENVGYEPCDTPRELTDIELDATQPSFDENGDPDGGTTSVRQMLAEFGNEPGWLAWVE